MENQAARQYPTLIRRALVCGRSDRRRLLARCAVMVDDFQQENPGTGYDDLVAAFGDPESFVAELLSGLESPKVEAAQKRQRLVRLGACMIVVIALAVISVFWYIQYKKSMNLNEYAIVIEYPPQIMTPEEYDALWKNTPEEARAGVWEELPENTP